MIFIDKSERVCCSEVLPTPADQFENENWGYNFNYNPYVLGLLPWVLLINVNNDENKFSCKRYN